MDYNYKQICQDLVKSLNSRTKDVISRRFGLKKANRETLQVIGDGYGITRERVRQIEWDGFKRLKSALKEHQQVFDYFHNHLKDQGSLKKEDILLTDLGGKDFQNQVSFLLALEDRFQRHQETDDLHALWVLEKDSLDSARKVIANLVGKMKKNKTPLSQEDLFDVLKKENSKLNEKALNSYVEVSKVIWQGPSGHWGLLDWPEINPRGIKDKSYLVFKNQNKPLHFREVTTLINELNHGTNLALPQTVHNELIRDARFVLVGRGMYALKEWGYEPGVVKDIVFKTLKESKKPLAREEIIEKVLSQRLVKRGTVFANLQDKKMFARDRQGRYNIRKV